LIEGPRPRPKGHDLVDASLVLHDIRVMKTKVHNFTIKLKERVARWARIEAARKETTVSRLLGEILKEFMSQNERYDRAMGRALARKPFLKTEGQFLSREEVHDRARQR